MNHDAQQVAEAIEADLKTAKKSLRRFVVASQKRLATEAVTLADKLEIKASLQAKEDRLRQTRRHIFAAEDAAAECFSSGTPAPFEFFGKWFPKGQAAIIAALGGAA